jgi:hypothetical protein
MIGLLCKFSRNITVTNFCDVFSIMQFFLHAFLIFSGATGLGQPDLRDRLRKMRLSVVSVYTSSLCRPKRIEGLDVQTCNLAGSKSNMGTWSGLILGSGVHGFTRQTRSIISISRQYQYRKIG